MNPMTTPSQCPKLTQLAEGCVHGACNVGALLICLGEDLREIPFAERGKHPAVKYIVGHVSYLLGESLGPTTKAVQDYEEWRFYQTEAA